MNDKTKQALELASEELQFFHIAGLARLQTLEAIAATREALAEQPAKCKHNVFAPYRCTQCEAEQPASNVNATGGPKAFFSLAKHPAQQQEPVAWRTFDGEGGYDYRTYDMNENYAKEWDKQNPKHKGWVEPLYTSPQPNKPWVGLNAKDFAEIPPSCFEGAIWADAKLREKNA